MRGWVAVLLALACLAGVSAAAQNVLPGNAKGDFRGSSKSGGFGLNCVFAADRELSKEEVAGLGHRPCLYIGPFRAGATWAPIGAELGPPHRSQKGEGGEDVFVYGLARTAPPYIVFRVRDGRITTIQLTGEGFFDFGFAGLLLGDREADILKALGPPSDKRQGPQIKGMLWDYAPFPVSLEVKDGALYSVLVMEQR